MTIALALLFAASCGSADPEPVRTTPETTPEVEGARRPAEPSSALEAAPVTGPACTQNVECSFCHWFVPADASACACPTCESVALGLEACGARMREFQRVCAAFLREHSCGPLSGCPPDDAVSTCLEGTCVRAPVVESTSGALSPCRSPADCPGRLRCVTASHGGPIGCTNEECCSADECGNGCVTNADCPSCRPRCESGSCRSLGGAP